MKTTPMAQQYLYSMFFISKIPHSVHTPSLFSLFYFLVVTLKPDSGGQHAPPSSTCPLCSSM